MDSDEDLLVVTGRLPAHDDADFEAALDAQRAEVRLASLQAASKTHELGVKSQIAGGTRRVVPAEQTNAGRSSHVQEMEDEIKGLKLQVQNQGRGLQKAALEAEKQAKLITALNARVDKEVALNRELGSKLRLAEASAVASKKEMALLQRDGATVSVATDGRLQKALDEIAALKMKLSQCSGPSNKSETTQVQMLQSEKQRLESQRCDLLNCIRKQSKLIEILRRQKLHLEAAKLLQLTEEDFMKALEM